MFVVSFSSDIISYQQYQVNINMFIIIIPTIPIYNYTSLFKHIPISREFI
jgi:hypothetical protein